MATYQKHSFLFGEYNIAVPAYCLGHTRVLSLGRTHLSTSHGISVYLPRREPNDTSTLLVSFHNQKNTERKETRYSEEKEITRKRERDRGNT